MVGLSRRRSNAMAGAERTAREALCGGDARQVLLALRPPRWSWAALR